MKLEKKIEIPEKIEYIFKSKKKKLGTLRNFQELFGKFEKTLRKF